MEELEREVGAEYDLLLLFWFDADDFGIDVNAVKTLLPLAS